MSTNGDKHTTLRGHSTHTSFSPAPQHNHWDRSEIGGLPSGGPVGRRLAGASISTSTARPSKWHLAQSNSSKPTTPSNLAPSGVSLFAASSTSRLNVQREAWASNTRATSCSAPKASTASLGQVRTWSSMSKLGASSKSAAHAGSVTSSVPVPLAAKLASAWQRRRSKIAKIIVTVSACRPPANSPRAAMPKSLEVSAEWMFSNALRGMRNISSHSETGSRRTSPRPRPGSSWTDKELCTNTTPSTKDCLGDKASSAAGSRELEQPSGACVQNESNICCTCCRI
mmetsp:Transcript_10003/g.26069  ORF Transcript_10003/g.26069 Transcript_10003/m.26069 type:complete len:284 (+) Transcript_10003:741-1592(+)